MRMLLDYGANPFLERELGWTALELAEQRGNFEIVQPLGQGMTEL